VSTNKIDLCFVEAVRLRRKELQLSGSDFMIRNISCDEYLLAVERGDVTLNLEDMEYIVKTCGMRLSDFCDRYGVGKEAAKVCTSAECSVAPTKFRHVE
jgi:hypothetical protein